VPGSSSRRWQGRRLRRPRSEPQASGARAPAKIQFGTTFREHLATLRLERAKRLLAATDLPVIEVAGHTGWSSLAHFNAVFRRRVGLTPSAFRAGELAFPTP